LQPPVTGARAFGMGAAPAALPLWRCNMVGKIGGFRPRLHVTAPGEAD
jgi:hypothetical protein